MATGWLRGTVKAVNSGDCLVIMGNVKSGPPPEKTITLSSLIAPKLARREGIDEPFAWDSREFLRKKCVGKEVVFRVDYTVASINREFGSVFLGNTNLAISVVSEGWAKVRTGGNDASPYLAELQALEEKAKTLGVGIWNKDPGASQSSIRNLPSESSFDPVSLVESSKGEPLPAIVEHVRDGSTLRLLLLPSFQNVQVYVAGIQSPSMGRRPIAAAAPAPAPAASESVSEPPPATDSGAVPSENGTQAPPEQLSAAQRIAASNAVQERTESQAEPYAWEAKHFTELKCLNRDVRLVLEGMDGKFSNLVGSVYYPEGDSAPNLGLELVKLGLAKVVEWSANMLDPSAKAALKSAELECKKQRLKIWTNFVPPVSNSVAMNVNFTGKVIEVVSGDCIIVADDAIPLGNPASERRVNLSSIRAKKMGNPRRDEKPEPYAREAKEFLRSKLVGQQVNVSMEYTRKMPISEGGSEFRNMEFGSVILPPALNQASSRGEGENPTPGGVNVAELVVSRGFATVIRHRDFEERSKYYEALLSAEVKAVKGKKGIHSAKDPPASHINDLSIQGTLSKAKSFLPFLQKARRLPAVVDYVLSGHRFKLVIPKEMCAIAFSLSGVRCPGKGEPFSEEAISFMRRRIMQKDVEIEVETMDKTGTFIGTLWEGKTNVSILLLESGLAKLHPSFSPDRTPDGNLLQSANEKAKADRIKVWANYVESEASTEGQPHSDQSQRNEDLLKVQVKEVMGGGKLYVVDTAGGKLAKLEASLRDLSLANKPPVGFLPKKGDVVISRFSGDGSLARAMVVNAPRPNASGGLYEVFYIDYGNQESVPLSSLHPLEPSLGSTGFALYCQLAQIKVPELEEDFGMEAAEYLNSLVLNKDLYARVEERDSSGGKARGQGTGTCYLITLVDPATSLSINASMLQSGLARLEKKKRGDKAQKLAALDALKEHQEVAKKARLNIWEYGDVESDDEDDARFRGRR